MKKLIFILLLFLPLTLFGQNYYIASWGFDAVDAGTQEAPWKTLSFSASQVHLAGSTLNLMTDITDNNRVVLDARVNVMGMGTKNITTSYVATSTADGYLYLVSSSTVNGAQSISYLNINGNNLTATRVGFVAFRSNVKIHHCTFSNFRDGGIRFDGTTSGYDVTPTNTKPTGNEVYYCTFSNVSTRYNNGTSGHLRAEGQDGMIIRDNVFIQNQRATGYNGNIFSGYQNYGLKFYNNSLAKNDTESDGSYVPNFFMEFHYSHGGVEIYDNDFIGAACLDLSGTESGTYDFGARIYRNTFNSASNTIPPYTSGSQNYITMESFDVMEDVYIYQNHFKNCRQAIAIDNIAVSLDNVWIYSNIIEKVGNADDNWSNAIFITSSWADGDAPSGYGVPFTNMYIYNNTIDAGKTCRAGILIMVIGDMTNINIKNNIIHGLFNYPVTITSKLGYAPDMNNLNINNNDFYGNTHTSISYASNVSYDTDDTGNITTNPLLTDVSAGNFILQASSPCIRTGVYIGTPVLLDYVGNDWLNPPSMGAYEVQSKSAPTIYTTFITNITETTAISGGQIDSDGGEAITARGVCWSTSTSPTTADDKTDDGTGTGAFVSNVTGLTNGETYYLRAYATNSIGTAYGLQLTFTTPIPASSGVRFLEHNGVLIIHNGRFVKSD